MFDYKKAGFCSLLDEYTTLVFSAGAAFQKGDLIEEEQEKMKKYQEEILQRYINAINGKRT